MRRQTVLDVVSTMADVATAAPQQHDVQFAAVRFSTFSTTMFDFVDLGCNKAGVVQAVRTMPLQSVGATVVDTGFVEVKDLLGRSTTFRDFAVPLVIVTITDADTLEAVRLLAMLQLDPFSKPSREVMLISMNDGVLLDAAVAEEEDDYYKNYYSTAETIGLTFDAIGRDGQFDYACEGAANEETLRNMTQRILDNAPCTPRVPVVCETTSTSTSTSTSSTTVSTTVAAPTTPPLPLLPSNDTAICGKAFEVLFVIDDSGSSGNNSCGSAIRRQTVLDVVNVMADVATAAPQQHDVQFAAVRFSTFSTTMFDFVDLGCNKAGVVQAVRTMPLQSVGATVVDTGFVEVKDLLGRSTTFRDFAVPLVIVTITDADTLEAVRLLAMLQLDPFSKPSREVMLISMNDGVLLDAAVAEEEDDYYKNYYSTAETIGLTFDAIGRDGQFDYACEGAANEETLRNMTQRILDNAPCTPRVPVVCDAA